MIVVAPLAGDFTVIPNALLRDRSLSFDAKAVMAWLLSLPRDWTVRLEQVRQHHGCNLARVKKLMRELTMAGWVQRRPPRRKPDGTFAVGDYVVFNVRQPVQDVLPLDAAEAADPESVKPLAKGARARRESVKPESGQPESGQPESVKRTPYEELNPPNNPPNPPVPGGTHALRESGEGQDVRGSEPDSGRSEPEEARRGPRQGRTSARHAVPAMTPDAAQRYRELVALYPADGVVGSRQRDAQALYAALSGVQQQAAIAAARLVADKQRRRPGHVLGLLTFLRQTDLSGGAPTASSAAVSTDLAAARNAAGLERAIRGEWPTGCSCFVAADTAAGAAWEAHFARFGVKARWMQLATGLGAYLPAPFPPTRVAA